MTPTNERSQSQSCTPTGGLNSSEESLATNHLNNLSKVLEAMSLPLVVKEKREAEQAIHFYRQTSATNMIYLVNINLAFNLILTIYIIKVPIVQQNAVNLSFGKTKKLNGFLVNAQGSLLANILG